MATAAPPAAGMPVSVARPYRRFIIPSMHRRFTNAAVLSLAVCLVQATWMALPTSIYGVLSTITIHLPLLFIPTLSIYVLRVANMHVGQRTSQSLNTQAITTFVSLQAVSSMLWYIFSAWFFCEVYMWSAPSSARLTIVDPGKSYERPRLNERPILLRSLFLCLAIAQCAIHLYEDYDRIPIPSQDVSAEIKEIENRSQQPFAATLRDMSKKLPQIAHHSLLPVTIVTFIGPFAYWLFIRQRAWSWSFWAARQIFNLPKASKQPVFPPAFIDLLARFLTEGFLLAFGWNFANTAFDILLAQAPMKQGRLLTEESNDPNGSLLNGIKAARPVTKSFALWELTLIASHMQQRRQLIYEDISRPGGSTWSQLYTVCLAELHAVVKRIQDDRTPMSQSVAAVPQPQNHLPRISNPIKQDNIFTQPKPVNLSQFRGQDHKAYNVVETGATKAIDYASAHAPQHEQLTKESMSGLLKSSLVYILQSPVGVPFRQTLARKASSVIFGTPFSDLGTMTNAITSLSKFVVHSKKGDRFGTVYRDIPNIVRTFTSTHATIQSYVQTLAVHWTDVTYKDEDRMIPDVQILLQGLEDGLRDIVNEFGEYADDLGLSLGEMRAAKQVAAQGRGRDEMRQVRLS